MNNVVRIWEDQENLTGEIELTDAELAGVYGAEDDDDDSDDSDDDGQEGDDDDSKRRVNPCAELFIKHATININCKKRRHHEDD